MYDIQEMPKKCKKCDIKPRSTTVNGKKKKKNEDLGLVSRNLTSKLRELWWHVWQRQANKLCWNETNAVSENLKANALQVLGAASAELSAKPKWPLFGSWNHH